ncbi:protein FAM200A-like [Erpetoichthys calabaricus]|uniref:protein FAM200A-like n=1 Tax=Erpetoichthys calabaricus TaxID=27687 RepID=UPI0010A03192|nr:protein FAM200A-like [Erpetoichthys calabaricus]
MTGKNSGVVQRIKAVAPLAVSYHCIIHREALAARHISEELHDVLLTAIKIVNYIKTRSLNTRLFEIICSEMGSEHQHLLFYTEVRWLSRGRVLQRFFELRNEVSLFLLQKNSVMNVYLCDATWLAKLAYLVDIFNALNDLNPSLQGRDSDLFKHMDKVSAFVKKLSQWKLRVEQQRLDMFQYFSEFVAQNPDSSIQEDISKIIVNHLKLLEENFVHYFPEDNATKESSWIRSPFTTDITGLTLTAQEEANLIELSCDSTLKARFIENSLLSFWMYAYAEYPELASRAISALLPFSSTYLCETGFSAMTAIKTKYRNRLDAHNDLRLSLLMIQPRTDKLVNSMQSHPTH